MSTTLDEIMALAVEATDCAYSTACNNDFGDRTPDALEALRTRLVSLVADAERYALLRRKVCIIGAYGKDATFHILNLDPLSDWKNDSASTILDKAIDAVRATQQIGEQQ